MQNDGNEMFTCLQSIRKYLFKDQFCCAGNAVTGRIFMRWNGRKRWLVWKFPETCGRHIGPMIELPSLYHLCLSNIFCLKYDKFLKDKRLQTVFFSSFVNCRCYALTDRQVIACIKRISVMLSLALYYTTYHNLP